MQVTLHLAEGGATDEDRARWSGELVEQFDPDSGDQVLGPRDEEAEAVTVAGVDGAVYARADGETAVLYVLLDPELGLTVAATDFAPGASTDALVTIGEAAAAQS